MMKPQILLALATIRSYMISPQQLNTHQHFSFEMVHFRMALPPKNVIRIDYFFVHELHFSRAIGPFGPVLIRQRVCPPLDHGFMVRNVTL